ncbi:MAG TPA: sigma-54 dependent transcriptional regulator [Myxococcales bacterium]|jgi:DNA-binding NtrC family response regulator
MKPRVLVVDDDAGVRYTLREILESSSMEVVEAADGAAALEKIDAEPFQLVISDLRMPKVDGMELLKKVRSRPQAPRVILITAHGSEKHAVEAMKLGAFDYFKKPFEMDELLAVVRRACETAQLSLENERLAGELNLSKSLVFASPSMSRLAVLIARVAPRDVTVLVTGESGTGKERVAEALVRASKRAAKPFVKFNCAALTAELAEAELFGHTKGAFTGAVRARPGLFGEADGGTLLLDEVAELAAPLQAKLLRVLQEGEVKPVGEDKTRRVDVRIVAATHRDLKDRVARGEFREDLYFRLNVVHLHIPPLRERPEDVEVLSLHFLRRFEERFGAGPLQLTDELFARLRAHPWPGNVRELENAIESMVALSVDGQLDLSVLASAGAESGGAPALGLKQRVEAYEKGLIVEALKAAKGNRSEAARTMAISRVTLHDKLNKYGLARPSDSGVGAAGEGEGA